MENIYDAPAADVVEVVRCGQCRNLYKIINSFNGHVSYRCSNPYGLQGHVLPHFYCVHGFKGENRRMTASEILICPSLRESAVCTRAGRHRHVLLSRRMRALRGIVLVLH